MWKRLVRRLAEGELRRESADAYLRGLEAGRRERPMTCGLSQAEHCIHSYMYDPCQ